MNQCMLESDLIAALKSARRSTGWNMRAVPVKTFEVGSCKLYVVPAKFWAYKQKSSACLKPA